MNQQFYIDTLHRPKYICCQCRKVFKRHYPIENQNFEKIPHQVKCAHCGGIANKVSPKFRAPKSSNIQAWKSVQVLFDIGILYDMIIFYTVNLHYNHYNRNKLPESSKALRDLLNEIRTSCQNQINMWVSADYSEKNKERISTLSEIIKNIDKQLPNI